MTTPHCDPPQPGLLVVLSDLHLGQDDCTAHAIRIARACARRWGGREDVGYLVAGDVCEGVNLRAELDSWRAVRDILGPQLLAIVPGNHDHAALGVGGVEGWRQREFFKRAVLDVWPVQGAAWPLVRWWRGFKIIGLDTQAGLAGWAWQADLARGMVGGPQLGRLAAELDTPAPRIVLGHHHLTYRTHLLPDDNRLLDVDDLVAVLDAAPRSVELWLMGHRHRYESWVDEAGCEVVIAAPKTTAPVHDGAGSVVVARLEGGHVTAWDRVALG